MCLSSKERPRQTKLMTCHFKFNTYVCTCNLYVLRKASLQSLERSLLFSINSNMAFLWLIFAFQTFAAAQSDIMNCEEPVIGRHICKLNKTMDNSVIELWPDLFLSGNPLNIYSNLIIDSIPEFNEDEGTITVNVILKLLWNDTRITFKSDDPWA